MKNYPFNISNKDGIYIVADDKFYTIDEWRKESDPKRAECVAINKGDTHLLICKTYISNATFDVAQEVAAGFTLCGLTCRCATRKESIDIYDARFKELDAAMELIGGAKLVHICWTCEIDLDPDPEYSPNYAFFYYGSSGGVSTCHKLSTLDVRPVTSFLVTRLGEYK